MIERTLRGGILPLLLALLSSLAARPALAGLSFIDLIAPFAQRTYDPLDPSATCYDVLYASDANSDGVLQNYEYTTFVAELSEGDFNETSYVDLPFTLKVNFIYLSCLCQFFDDGTPVGNCCEGPEGGIAVGGGADGIALGDEDAYLRTVCAETQGAIEYAREEAGFTEGPSGMPSESPTKSPTAGPTESPTRSPSAEPTTTPSDDPTSSPTDPPSKSPSLRPTASPSVRPSKSPSAPPTASPSTASPTMTPTPAPSRSPATEPVTEYPTTSPTKRPTDTPSEFPSAQPTEPPTTASPSTAPTPAPSRSPAAEPVAEDPTAAPTTEAPVVGTLSPAASPATEAPVAGTEAPVVGTGAPTLDTATTAPIVGTPVPTAKPTLARVTSAPVTNSPTAGTATPTTSSRPSEPSTSGFGAAPLPTPPTSVESPKQPGNPPDGNGTDTDTIAPGALVGIALVAAFVVGAAGYVLVNRRKRDPDDPPLEELANKELDADLEAGREAKSRRLELPGDDRPPSSGGSGDSEGAVNPSASGFDRGTGVSDAATYLHRGTADSDGAALAVERGTSDTNMATYAGEPYDAEAVPDDRTANSGTNSGGGSYDAAGFMDSDEAVYSGEPYDARGSEDSGNANAYVPQPLSSPPTSPPQSSSLDVVEGSPASPRRADATDSSSAASEGGWSSSQGMSSINTASFDNGTDDEGLLPGSPDRLLAAIGAADTATHAAGSTQRDQRPSFVPVGVGDRNDGGSTSSTDSPGDRRMTSPMSKYSSRSPPSGKVSREDLNAAIEAGDWAMVGATAALLADSSHSDQDRSVSSEIASTSSRSEVTDSQSEATDSITSSAHRAQELDRMVVRGDWEGVVLAAAQYEGTGSSRHDDDASGSASASYDAALARSQAEIRAEVERLVRRVVPDEVENIDEMMLQFDGREEELIETLRTMQERNVAQRARAAVKKTAKLEARARAELQSGEGGAVSSVTSVDHPLRRTNSGSCTSSAPSHYGDSNAGSSSVSSYMESSVSDLEMSHDDQSSSRRTTQSSLELAIERGDWRAVGEAAAMMGGPSALLPDPDALGDDGSLSSGLSRSAGKTERVYYLDALIAKGDWSGIVAAAGKYQAIDDRSLEPGNESEANAEEREALAQATMWENIADRSRKAAGSGDETRGASDAADWAISRLLEKKMSEAADSDAVGESDAKKPRVTDDESV